MKTLASSYTTCSDVKSLVSSKSIYKYEKVLYEKTIFGRKLKIRIKIDATLSDYKNIRFKGSVIYDIFGKTKTI